MREHSLSNSHGQTDGRASPSRDENRQRKKNKKKRKREHAMASHDHTSSQDAARELPTNAERESVSGERGAMTQVDNNPGKSFPPPSPVEDSSHVALGHGETKDGANGPGKSATETQKQQQQGDTFSSSPPQERRRLGKTHGRARKAAPGVAPTGSGRSSTGDGGFGRGGGKAGTGLTPDGPGQGTPRKHTLSVAIPGSVVDNAQNRELKTYLVRMLLFAFFFAFFFFQCVVFIGVHGYTMPVARPFVLLHSAPRNSSYLTLVVFGFSCWGAYSAQSQNFVDISSCASFTPGIKLVRIL